MNQPDKIPTLSPLLNRYVRFRDAPNYLGMNRNRFNEIVRPYVTEIYISKQALAFDRLELDHWADQYKQRNGRPGKSLTGDELWDEKHPQGSLTEMENGTSTKSSVGSAFAKAVAQVNSKKRNKS